MPDLTKISTEDLVAELERRHAETTEAEVPRPLPTMDWNPVIKLCGYHLKTLQHQTKQYIYEAAMEAVYGDGVWDWINRQ
jgi:hypothetical protein